jgi:hypothetical protein
MRVKKNKRWILFTEDVRETTNLEEEIFPENICQ